MRTSDFIFASVAKPQKLENKTGDDKTRQAKHTPSTHLRPYEQQLSI